MKSYIVDSFTTEPFKGNSAGVCFAEQALSDDTMLKIAQEFGFSETAFVLPGDKETVYSIRYFSPKKEIPLCGHATLASAKVIFTNTVLEELHFITVEKLDLLIRRQGDGIAMEFPVYGTVAATVPPAMLAALGLQNVVNTVFSTEKKIFVLEISDAVLLAALQPDFAALVAAYTGINGVLVTAPGDGVEYDFHYRYFWPWAGTNEDPVTGGVQTFLAKYWGDKLGKTRMKAFQPSSRTGAMQLELQHNKVLLTGKAVIVLEGNLLIY